MSTLVEDFRRGVVNTAKLHEIQKNGFESFKLYEAVGLRPTLYSHPINAKNPTLDRIVTEWKLNHHTTKRIGKEFDIPNEMSFDRDELQATATSDELKIWDDVCTKFCTNKYFPDTFSRVNMICNVISVYNHVSKLSGLNFKIMFKGGVMLRLVMLECFQDINFETRQKLIDYIDKQKAARISDFDFEIVSKNPKVEHSEVHQSTLLNYLVLLLLKQKMNTSIQNRIRGIETEDDLLPTPWDMTDMSALVKALQDEVDELTDSSHSLYGCTVDHVTLGVVPPPAKYSMYKKTMKATDDKFIFKCRRKYDTTCIAPATHVLKQMGFSKSVYNLASENQFTYATHNDYIGEDTPKTRDAQLNSLFQLNRIKHNFVVYYTTRRGKKCCDRIKGEMIDLSQSYGTKYDEGKKFTYNDAIHNTPYMYYNLLGVETPKLYSYTIHGFMLDHRLMIHFKDEDPWDTEKFEKRIVRYVIFFVLFVLSVHCAPTIHMRSKLKMLRTMLNDIAKKRHQLPKLKPRDYGVDEINKFMKTEVYSLVVAYKSHDTNMDALKKYFDILVTHMDTILNFFEEHAEFIENPKWKLKTLKSNHAENWSTFLGL